MYIRVVQVLILELLSASLALNCTACASLDYSKTNPNTAQRISLLIADARLAIGNGTN